MKREARVIYLTGTHAWLFRSAGGGLVLAGRDEYGPQHLPNFVDSLGEAPTIATYVVVDVIDEQYNVGTVPHARGTDRRAVLRRHAEKIFRNSPYRYTVVQGRQSQGRKDDIVLTTSIVNADLVAPLLDKLRELGVAVVGVCSLPVISGEILRDLSKSAGQRLVVTHQSSGLRLSFFQDRKLKMSRLTPIRDEGPESLAKQIRDEVDKTQKYLGRLRLTAHDAELVVHLLVEDGMMGPLLVECVDGGNLRFSIDPISQWLWPVGNDEQLAVTPADCLIAQLVMAKKVTDHYGTSGDKRYANLYRSVHQMRLAGGVTIAVSLLAALFLSWEGQTLESERAQAQRDEEQTLRQAALVESGLPKIPVGATDLKGAVRAADKLMAMQVLPVEAMSNISRVLEHHRNVKIMSMHWRSVTPEDMLLQTSMGGEDAEMYDDQGRFRMRYVTTVTAQLEGFNGDFERAYRDVRDVLEGLREDGYFEQVKLVHSSVSNAGDTSLSGEFKPRSAEEDVKPEFTFEATVGRMYEP